MKGREAIVAILSAVSMGCVGKAPASQTVSLNDPGCAGTRAGAACLTLEFVVSDAVRQNAGGRCDGYLNWALYRGGAVGGLGPNGSSVQGATVPNVNLSQAGDSYLLTLPDIEARSYQALAYISQHASSSSAASGDPVTLPSGSFSVPANEHTQVRVILDYIR